jgi:GxxExxY protein
VQCESGLVLQEEAEEAEQSETASALCQGVATDRSNLIESVYEWCLMRELELHHLRATNQKVVRITYKGFSREEPLRFDLLVEECVLVEMKAAAHVLPIRKAQLLSYMKLLDVPLGLLINFNVTKLTDGVSRLILPGADS